MSYLHLTRADNPVSTLILYHCQDQPLQELKDVCITSLDSFQQLLYTPAVLAGGGCWQVGLSNYLRNKIENEKRKLSEVLECPASTIQQACILFRQALITAALGVHSCSVSRHSGHVFSNDDVKGDDDSDDNDGGGDRYCLCGIYKARKDEELIRLREDEDMCVKTEVGKLPVGDAIEKHDSVVMDSFSMCVNALQTSVLTACSVLKIGQVVENL
ncbi:molecular chaperone MKKS-like isoform X1 [Mercenaria mercenaria]|uniref:molecular chaperone MKKS-like isoform X1 n=1 Tax=Mercenaria mercenaria TaxID=6596 RepID=UPI00234F9AEC|nr:molecular chaperone MKKS-like isoform X1 [Mercenaria mercenaria]XP_053400184.1 molecular chaperone MKKS-like isoform X1 [Mercenaria mercenaria]XP_053400188.1 molecular chaperone MKKS-like isoform X1 [Mercenaria mercenaria]XP_053400192.1 molecular chaperone MKKS-like isoform X1 [Mercenaria mercenaria]XP_053400195.1 molecular chaperone MKKS-like isoform X1 [Mercenaria mercenaria]XP_053400201.1 molecular chaperone MKKS-like isoform X1 [Mercenaria mercenaria]